MKCFGINATSFHHFNVLPTSSSPINMFVLNAFHVHV